VKSWSGRISSYQLVEELVRSYIFLSIGGRAGQVVYLLINWWKRFVEIIPLTPNISFQYLFVYQKYSSSTFVSIVIISFLHSPQMVLFLSNGYSSLKSEVIVKSTL
jgi:hypothetical protein